MDYIQRKLIKSLNENRDHLNAKMDTIISDLAEHCSHEQLKGLVQTSVNEKTDSLRLFFQDMVFTIDTQKKFAFDNSYNVGLKTSFYNGDDFICSAALSRQGFVEIKNSFNDEVLTYEYDAVDLPKAILHVLLLTSHQKGYIWLG